MATICNITITSDIAPGFGGISESMTLTQAGNLTDIDSTTGFSLRKLSATGKLYGGDWMMMPLTCIDADDVTANPDTDNTVVLEYIMFYEEA